MLCHSPRNFAPRYISPVLVPRYFPQSLTLIPDFFIEKINKTVKELAKWIKARGGRAWTQFINIWKESGDIITNLPDIKRMVWNILALINSTSRIKEGIEYI